MTCSLYGYIEDTEKGRSMDPGVTGVSCIICHDPLVFYDLVMISVGEVQGREYFYRTHESCYAQLPQASKDALGEVVWENVALDMELQRNLQQRILN